MFLPFSLTQAKLQTLRRITISVLTECLGPKQHRRRYIILPSKLQVTFNEDCIFFTWALCEKIMFSFFLSSLSLRFLKRSHCWCSQHWTVTMSAALPTVRQEVERRTLWKEMSLMTPEVSFPELCSKSSKPVRSWEHKAGR